MMPTDALHGEERLLRHPFPPVWDEACTALILGSFPSARSRAEGFFYGHPQNRFWAVLAAMWEEETPRTVPEKRTFLLAHHLALWDAAFSCEIEGSADSAIRRVTPTDLSPILGGAPIAHVFANGTAAYRLYERYQRRLTGIGAIRLPSTSPANAAWSAARLTEAWRAVRGNE